MCSTFAVIFTDQKSSFLLFTSLITHMPTWQELFYLINQLETFVIMIGHLIYNCSNPIDVTFNAWQPCYVMSAGAILPMSLWGMSTDLVVEVFLSNKCLLRSQYSSHNIWLCVLPNNPSCLNAHHFTHLLPKARTESSPIQIHQYTMKLIVTPIFTAYRLNFEASKASQNSLSLCLSDNCLINCIFFHCSNFNWFYNAWIWILRHSSAHHEKMSIILLEQK